MPKTQGVLSGVVAVAVVMALLVISAEASLVIKKVSMEKVKVLEDALKHPPLIQHKNKGTGVVGINTNKPGVDLCPVCVDFMSEVINQLINIILQIGVAGGCQSICSYLDNQVEQGVCLLICELVGVTEFGNIITYEDPDPIFICEEFALCAIYNGGNATISRTVVSPPYGPEGTTFTLTMYYTVVKHTSPGLLSVFINPPDGFPMAGQNFVEGQAPGSYVVGWSVETQPNEDEAFSPGVYPVEFAVCEGDCTTSHQWGGVYAEATSSFKISN